MRWFGSNFDDVGSKFVEIWWFWVKFWWNVTNFNEIWWFWVNIWWFLTICCKILIKFRILDNIWLNYLNTYSYRINYFRNYLGKFFLQYVLQTKIGTTTHRANYSETTVLKTRWRDAMNSVTIGRKCLSQNSSRSCLVSASIAHASGSARWSQSRRFWSEVLFKKFAYQDFFYMLFFNMFLDFLENWKIFKIMKKSKTNLFFN